MFPLLPPAQQLPLDAQTISSLKDMSVLGVAFVFGLALVIYAWRRPTQSAGDNVLTTITALYDKKAAAAEKAEAEHRQEMKALTEKHALEIKATLEGNALEKKELTERLIAVTERANTAMEAVVGKQDSYNKEIADVKTALDDIKGVGTDVQTTVHSIEDKVRGIPEYRLEDKQLKEGILGQIKKLGEQLAAIDERLKTKEMQPAPQALPTPSETTN